ncbi:hypothetical protein RRF57_000552 [Xylaria bambusicola]|uniref:Uncharacterized protein n=1 Tax=Xylaria bambusicola TaxID=326684 RepID=A0AAN7UD58_9PEZI
MHIIEILDLETTKKLIDAETLEPSDGQRGRERRQQHVRLREFTENMVWSRFGPFPFNGIV